MKFFAKITNVLTTYAFLLVDFIATMYNIKAVNYKNHQLLIIRPDLIGDYILFRNFIEIIKKSELYKDCEITMIGNSLWKDFAEKYDKIYIERFIWINFKDFNKDIRYRFKVMRIIASQKFDTVINPVYSRTFLNEQIVKTISATNKITLNICKGTNINSRQAKLVNKYYTRIIETGEENIFEFDRNTLFISKLLNANLQLSKPQLTPNNDANNKYLSSNSIVIVLGASHEKRRWSAVNFAQLANQIFQEYNSSFILVGSKNETNLGLEFLEVLNPEIEVINLIGKTTLIELTSIIANGQFLISNETGLVHLAVALNKSIICISNGNHLGRFSPYPSGIYENIKYVFHPEINDRILNNENNEFRYGSFLNINDIQISTVFEKVKYYL